MFFYFFLDSNKKTLYLCNVFFIVLDLRLTKVRVAAANGIILAARQLSESAKTHE